MLHIMPFVDPLLIIGIIAVLSLVGFVIEYQKRKDIEKQLRDGNFVHSQEKAQAIIEDAEKKSHSIALTAEEERKSLLRDTNEYIKDIDKEYESTVDSFSKDIENEYSEEIKELTNDFRTFVEYLERESNTLHLTATDTNQKRMDALFKQVEETLQKTTSDISTKSNELLSAHLSQTNQAVEEYKKARLEAVDKHIFEIVDKTLPILLAKSISSKDQLELITEALDQAKKETFLS